MSEEGREGERERKREGSKEEGRREGGEEVRRNRVICIYYDTAADEGLVFQAGFRECLVVLTSESSLFIQLRVCVLISCYETLRALL